MQKHKIRSQSVEITPEQQREINYKRLYENVYGNIPNPTYHFEVGDKVRFGNHTNVIVKEKRDNDRVYELEYDLRMSKYKIDGPDNPVIGRQSTFAFWFHVRPPFPRTETILSCNKEFRPYYSNTTLDSLLYRYYQAGIDLDPEYQREYVWTPDDKLALIDSVFNNRDIGKFAFVERNWKTELKEKGDGLMWEILDGKQRLRTLLDYYENRFSYKGIYYSDLCFEDIIHWREFPITYAEIPGVPDRKTVLKCFLHLNRSGRIMDADHLAKIQTMLDNL